MTTREMWRTEAGRMLTAEINGMRLVVERLLHTRPAASGQAEAAVRFQVLRRMGADGGHELIACGTRPDVRAAMAAAEEMAKSRMPG